MKKITLILAILVSSCGYAPIDNSNPVIITRTESLGNGYCDYYGTGNPCMTFSWCLYEFKFRDSTRKYQIGDTIRFK